MNLRKTIYNSLPIIILFSGSCTNSNLKMNDYKVVYKSNDLFISQITKNTLLHTSFLQTKSFGLVPCNGLIITNSNEALVFDTTADSVSSEELINWIQEQLHCKINAVIPTHFHDDNLGGLEAFEKKNIPSFAYFKTIQFAKEKKLPVPQKSFDDSILLKVGNEKAIVKFLGEGHTKDNVVCYFPSEKVLFGGCLIKELNATKGNLHDANTKVWSETVKNVKRDFPTAVVVIPGHGKTGNQELLDYTIRLFNQPSDKQK